MPFTDFLAIGSSVTNGGNYKYKHAAAASEVTKYKRLAAQFRPYIQGGPTGTYLPKGNYWKSQEDLLNYKLGFRFGPIFDGTYKRPQN